MLRGPEKFEITNKFIFIIVIFIMFEFLKCGLLRKVKVEPIRLTLTTKHKSLNSIIQ